jgi:hypothetical protein
MIFRSLLAAAALLFAVPSAHAAFDVGDLICETSTTTGTGTLNLAGAVTNYVTFVSQITSGSTVPYHIIASDGKLETGIGTFTDATPDTLARVADWSTDGSGAELTLPAGTHTACLGPIASSLVHNPSVANITIFDGLEVLVGGEQVVVFQDVATAVNEINITNAATGVYPGFESTGGDTDVGISHTTKAAGYHSFNVPGNATNNDNLTVGEFVLSTTGTAAAGLGATFDWALEDSAGGAQSAGSMQVIWTDATDTSEDSYYRFQTKTAGATVNGLSIGSLTDLAATGVYINKTNGIVGVDANAALRIHEAEANGDNYKGFITTAAVTADTTCTFEDDANFIPDSCVGDGSDASDGRLKDIIGPVGDVGGMLDGIKIYDYKWNTDSDKSEAVRKGKRGVGPVAQELFNINPDWVEVGGDDPIKDPWAWKPEKVVPYLIVEVQNLRKRLANQACYGIKLGSACIGVSM